MLSFLHKGDYTVWYKAHDNNDVYVDASGTFTATVNIINQVKFANICAIFNWKLHVAVVCYNNKLCLIKENDFYMDKNSTIYMDKFSKICYNIHELENDNRKRNWTNWI